MFWKILNKNLPQNKEEVLKIILSNRHLQTKKEVDEYFNPPLPEKITLRDLGIKLIAVKKAIKRIKKAIFEKSPIIVYGDYDADGICGTAILWETLFKLKANVMPYIPSRTDEGYGLSEKGIEKIIRDQRSPACSPRFPSRLGRAEADGEAGRRGREIRDQKILIITVDHGIVANKQVEYAKKKGIEVIITDHHVPPKKLPKAFSIIHTTKLSGSGVSWFFAREILKELHCSIVQLFNCYLDLVAIGSIADLVPLTDINRILVKYGLKQLNQTKRIGLLELIKDAGLDLGSLGNYEVGYILAPRLNAMGRLEHALDSLRLLCTNNKTRAKDLAQKLGLTNRERQELTEKTTIHAKNSLKLKAKSEKLIFISYDTYNQGVIGLVAGRIVETFYRPTVVVSKGKEISKASARSINGFNIIEAIRKCSNLLIDCGGHPMAAGFTIETKYLAKLKDKLEKIVERSLPEEKLERERKIDCEIKLSNLSLSLYDSLQKMQPFGIGNPESVFLTRNLRITDFRLVGRNQNHLKLKLDDPKTKKEEEALGLVTPSYELPIASYDGIGFNLATLAKNFKIGDLIDVVYILSMDEWNGNKRLQLKIKDLKITTQ